MVTPIWRSDQQALKILIYLQFSHLHSDLEIAEKRRPCKTLLNMAICQRKATIVSEYVGLTDVS